MVLLRHYDKEKQIDFAWFQSSNVLYSECDDTDTAKKTLRVTFNNGATYEYKKVDVHDYLMFLYGGVDRLSNGKALNKYIKSKYECEKLDKKNPDEVKKEMIELDKKLKEENNEQLQDK